MKKEYDIAKLNPRKNPYTNRLKKQVTINKNSKISCSIGITMSDEFTDVNQVDGMIKLADDSLYNVKAAGKGRYIFT